MTLIDRVFDERAVILPFGRVRLGDWWGFLQETGGRSPADRPAMEPAHAAAAVGSVPRQPGRPAADQSALSGGGGGVVLTAVCPSPAGHQNGHMAGSGGHWRRPQPAYSSNGPLSAHQDGGPSSADLIR